MSQYAKKFVPAIALALALSVKSASISGKTHQEGPPAMTHSKIEPAQYIAAKVAGILYLVQMAVAIFGESFVRGRLIVAGDPALTAQNITAHERLFRVSIAGDLLVYISVIVLIWALYVVLRPVNRNLAVLAIILRLAENAVLCAGTVNAAVALRLLSRPDYLKTFERSQLDSLARLALSAQGLTMNVGFILLGLGSTVFAYLFLKSRYIPRALAAWGIFASLVLGILTWIIIVFPGLGTALGLTYMIPMFIYEVGLGFWLVVKGIREPTSALLAAKTA
jgi:hypothetical protein